MCTVRIEPRQRLPTQKVYQWHPGMGDLIKCTVQIPLPRLLCRSRIPPLGGSASPTLRRELAMHHNIS